MKNYMTSLLNGVINFFKFLFIYYSGIFIRLNIARSGISFKNLVRDSLTVLGSAGMLLFLNGLALIIFLFLPQGKDVIYIVSEDLAVSHKIGNLLWLLFGVLLWSYVSEFASRYATYVTDNSGMGLTDQRVEWRKELQRAMSSMFLILPYFIVLIAILVNYLQDNTLSTEQQRIGFGVPAVLIYLMLNLVSHIYFGINDPSKKNRLINSIREKRKIPRREKEWAEKLYGMYNDYVFSLRKPENFVNIPRHLLEEYANFVKEKETKKTFPQNKEYMDPESIIPPEFKLKTFSTEDHKDQGRYRWVYYIPNNFYLKIHSQLRTIVIVCLIIFLIFTFLPIAAYQNIGAPGLLILSFSCWIGIYMGILFLDYAIFRERFTFLKEPITSDPPITNDQWSTVTPLSKILSKVSIRTILIVLLVTTSLFNADHPVRYNANGKGADNRPGLKEHFQMWFNEFRSDSINTRYVSQDGRKFYPIVFVCAEGGAMRTGAFTALLLSYLDDQLSTDSNSLNFHKFIYAFSSVSGGSLGASFFNAEAYLNNRSELLVNDSLIDRTRDFFRRDFLAPVIGKMFYGDLINIFIPIHIERFDRAIALEKAWENGYQNVINSKGRNYFSSDYMNIYSKKHTFPAMFINTSEVESGRQCWLCNVKPDSSMYKFDERDLFNYRLRNGINYSTMINFSSRFPLFSPAATVVENDVQKYHYLDGGYTENTGAATMTEILEAIKPMLLKSYNGYQIKPYVIELRFSDGKETFTNINFGNEISEILLGIYNTRAGRAEAATDQLQYLVETEFHGEVISLYLDMNKSQVPMNWVLSDKSVDNILTDIKTQYKSQRMAKLFPFDPTCCRCSESILPIKNDSSSLVSAQDTTNIKKDSDQVMK